MLSPSLACDPSLGTKLVDLLPASIVNVAIAFSFFSMQPAWNNYFPAVQFTFVMNAIGDLFPSFKCKEIFPQLSPTVTVKELPTSTLRYQPGDTSSILYAVALCTVFIVFGAVFTIFRNNAANLSSSSSSSVNVPFKIGPTYRTYDSGSPLDSDFETDSNETPVALDSDPIHPSSSGPEKLSGNNSSIFLGDIGGPSPSPFTTSGMDDGSSKNAPGFLAKLKMILVLFTILATLIHGGRITQKIRSSAMSDDFTLSYNHTSATLYFQQALELITTKPSYFDIIPVTPTHGNTPPPNIVEELTIIPSDSIPSSTLHVYDKKIPSSGLSPIFSPSILWSRLSCSGKKYQHTSVPFPTKDVMSSIPAIYPSGLSIMTVKYKLGTPTISPSKTTLALKYIKVFILFFVFCILIPILSFVMTILPTVIRLAQVLKSKPADQRETFTCAADDQVMQFGADAVLVTEVVENSKVDINVIHDEAIPVSTFVNKGKGKSPETIEGIEESDPCPPEENLDLATPSSSSSSSADNLVDPEEMVNTEMLVLGPRRTRLRRARTPRRVRLENKRRREAEKAAIEAALETVPLVC